MHVTINELITTIYRTPSFSKFDGASVTYILDIFHKCLKW